MSKSQTEVDKASEKSRMDFCNINFGKLFSRVLNNRLSAWAEDYHIYIEARAGFRKLLMFLIFKD